MLRRINDYAGSIIWACTLVFSLGVLYTQIQNNTSTLAEQKVYIDRYSAMRVELDILKLKQEYQREWQADFMVTFKEMVAEMKTTNQSVQKQSYQLQAIERELKNGKRF